MRYKNSNTSKGYDIIPEYPEGVNHDDPQDFEYLNCEEKAILLDWCSQLGKTHNMNRQHHSYGLKHVFERSRDGFYITNGTFKGAMLKLGFRHENVQKDGMNWYFNYSEIDLNLLENGVNIFRLKEHIFSFLYEYLIFNELAISRKEFFSWMERCDGAAGDKILHEFKTATLDLIRRPSTSIEWSQLISDIKSKED
ncbi:hypothetical protein IX317_000603 [Fusobacterium sp. DD29]|uniref:hypothetical protein n=1 Tax=unclassified Fusobacterium TaxID=2648384 RepID=UPI001B8BD98B|nr:MULTISPECIES: hypothetical protein [unclassified Fusobacterium]MBR8700275.1 hypothetical protein [Fusobacterium sp. DD45]MBR8710470.1 hypothetical protein [Fusobacterium sp. DD28]MBR8748942.1 hypothetical protein [Fusobacterium sp. DD29]MBR8751080.1 hypothetical protein [Fusobacterium sp. DD26]MBR8761248.1 hypothetical protein [Fusobacterium sp. DD25]